MALSPQDIEGAVFRERMRGYDQDQVDAFLDRLSDRLSELIDERDRMAERLRTLETDAAESLEAERLLKRTLITAQRTADETIAEARQQASATLEESRQRAETLLGDAEREAAATLEDARRRSAEMLDDAERRAAETTETAGRQAVREREAARSQFDLARRAIAELRRFRAEYRDRVRVVVAEQLAALERAGDLPDLPAGVDGIARLAEEHADRGQPGPAQSGPAQETADVAAAPAAGGDTEPPQRPGSQESRTASAE